MAASAGYTRADTAGRILLERELELIHSMDLFASLPLPTLENLASRFVPVRVAPGEVLIREGDAGDRFYVIEDGKVVVSLNGRPVATLGPEKYFGEIALMHA